MPQAARDARARGTLDGLATLGAREPRVDRVLESDPHAGDGTGPRGDREVDPRGEPRVRDPRRPFDYARVRGGRALLDGRHSGRRDRAPLACADRRRAAAPAGARSVARAPGAAARLSKPRHAAAQLRAVSFDVLRALLYFRCA